MAAPLPRRKVPAPGAIVGFADAVLCVALAIAVLAIDAGRRANRVLALLLVAEAGAQLSAAVGNLPGSTASTYSGFNGVFALSLALIPAFQILVVAELDTPIGHRLRSPAASIAVGLLGVVTAGFYLSDAITSAEIFIVPSASLVVCSAIGVWAWVRAPRHSPRRRQATAFLLAFGLRDLLFLAYFLPALLGGTPPDLFGIELPFLATLLFVPLLAYAILHVQLFDIDLRLKRGIRTGAMGGAFFAVFFVVSEAAQLLLSERMGPWVGLAACGLLVFAFSPLQRAADRVAAAALPGVSASSDYLAFRKLEVYKAAVESAHESGGISEKERESLARLRAKLGLRPEDAAALERDVLTAAASAT